MTSRTAYIGLGANTISRVGDPQTTVLAAMDRLGDLGPVVACSSLYLTEPVGYLAQPAFVNAVAAVETELDAERILKGLLGLEREFGRNRVLTVPNGPRPLDLDLLLLGDAVTRLPGLTVPHPELARRRFVLAPLAEIAPNALHPVFRQSMAELLATLPDEGANARGAVRILKRQSACK